MTERQADERLDELEDEVEEIREDVEDPLDDGPRTFKERGKHGPVNDMIVPPG